MSQIRIFFSRIAKARKTSLPVFLVAVEDKKTWKTCRSKGKKRRGIWRRNYFLGYLLTLECSSCCPGEHHLNIGSFSHLQRTMARFCIAVRAIALSCCWGAILSMAAVFPSTMTSEELAPGVTVPVNSSDASSLGATPYDRAGWIGQFDQYVFSSFLSGFGANLDIINTGVLSPHLHSGGS